MTTLLGNVDFVNRGAVLVFVFAVWALQLWWSEAWLSRFLFGPAEWLWRVATYIEADSRFGVAGTPRRAA